MDNDVQLIAELTGGSWRLARNDGSVIHESLSLLPDGTISGVHTPNEASWRVRDRQLEFLDRAGVVTTRFVNYEREDEQLRSLAGPYLSNPATGIVHVLSRLADRHAAAASQPPDAGFDAEARCVPGAALAGPAIPLEVWHGPTASILIAPDTTVNIRDIAVISRGYSRRFEGIVERFFSATEYRSTPWTATILKLAVSTPPGAILTEYGGTWHCVRETLGHSSNPPYHHESEYVCLHKQEGGAEIAAHIRRLQPAQDDGALNVILSAINNYGHWHVHNVALLLWLARNAPTLLDRLKLERIRLLCPFGLDHVGSGMKNFAVQCLATSVPTELTDTTQEPIPCALRNVLVSSSLSLDQGVRWSTAFPDLFVGLRRPVTPSAPRLIYCNRGHAGRRGIINEPELESALVEIGFTTVSPGSMSFDQQRDVFANARLIVGAHGAALTNMVYAHTPPAIVELSHTAYGEVQYNWFRHLAAVFGGAHGAAISVIPEEFRRRSYDDIYFLVDTAALLNAIHPLLDMTAG